MAAAPPDVREASGFPVAGLTFLGLRPDEGVALKEKNARRKGIAFPHIGRHSRNYRET